MNPIQWFPGHMAKAKREIKENIKLVDLIIELKDARIPYSSTNPMVDEIVGNKPRLILLCKSSIADPKITKEWMDYYKSLNILSLDIDSITGYNVKNVVPYARLALKEVFEKRESKGIKSKQIKALIIGIPNVGKSTLMNTLAKRKVVAVGDRPGVTKSQTWIKITDDLFLLDTPGILWPKFEDQTVGLKLAMCRSIKDEILDMEYITDESVRYLSHNYPNLLKDRYNLEELNEDPIEVLKEIGKKRGCMLKGGLIDLDRVRTILMN
jgi:ribosome biogenesis GTPase A